VSRTVVLFLAGGLLIALGVGWRLFVTWRIRRRLISLLGSADPATRAGTLTILVAEGIERYAPALRRMAETETDPAVLNALAEAVNRTQVMPARTPDLVSLRLWAATRPGTEALPSRPTSIPIEGVVVSNGSATDKPAVAAAQASPAAAAAQVSSAGRHRLPAPARHSVSMTPEITPPPDLLVPVAFAASNGRSADHATAAADPVAHPPAGAPRTDSAGRSAARDDRAVLVTGAGGPAGVAVIRALRRAGHRVVACDADAYAVGFRLADEFARVPRADDPAFTESMIKAVARSGAVALISTVAEELVPLHAAAVPLAEAGAAIWLPGPWTVEHCVDKWLFYELMTQHGVPVPATGRYSERGVPGPWIVKPRFGRGSRDVYDAANVTDLTYALSHAPEPLVQTKITGREFTVDTLSGPDGRLYGAVPRWRVETKAGISTKGITFDDPELTGMVAELLGVLRLEGPACVQGFRTDEGQLVFIEVNPRFSGGLPLSLASGADLVGQYLNRILGGVVQPERLHYRSGVTMLRYFDEVFEE
jgi:carbamoyl-phosphate synthase large subunit